MPYILVTLNVQVIIEYVLLHFVKLMGFPDFSSS